MFNLHSAISERLNWPMDRALDEREARILGHYQRQLERGYMDQLSAFDRCLGDLAGRNYHHGLEQRSI